MRLSIKALLKGPSRKTTKIGQSQVVERMVGSRNFAPIRVAKIHYMPIEISRRYLYPWQKDFTATLWHMRVEIKVDGVEYSKVVVSEMEIKQALNHALLEGLNYTIQQYRRHEQLRLAQVG